MKNFKSLIKILFIIIIFSLSMDSNASDNVTGSSKVIVERNDQVVVRWCILGDSISDHRKYGETTPLYMDYIAATKDVETTNLAMMGTGFKSFATDQVFTHYTSFPYYMRVASMSEKTTLLTVFGSFNDVLMQDYAPYPYGTIFDNTNLTLYGCLNLFLYNALKINSSVKVGLVLPLPWASLEEREPYKTRCMEYVAILKNWALIHNIPILDLYEDYQNWNYNIMDRSNYLDFDGAHVSTMVHLTYLTPKVNEFLEYMMNM
ncbi:MAG: hypothetical protein Q4F88_00235 [Eubacteriales bacterium]|nr:hypothetical protein [Eubacteriales bacterium]